MVNVFLDKICSSEIGSDGYEIGAPFEEVEFSSVAFEIKTRYVKKGNDDFGISHNQDEDAEGPGGTGGDDATVERVVDVIDSFKLREDHMGKKEFQQYFAAYMKKVLLPSVAADNLEAWKGTMTKLFKKMTAEYDNASIFVCELAHEQVEDNVAMPIYGYWHGEEESPRLIYFREGVKEVKY